MTHPSKASGRKTRIYASVEIAAARDTVGILANYREPSTWRSWWELLVTAGPFLSLWALAWQNLDFGYTLAVSIAVLYAAFLVRLFMIQHDCGHASFFGRRAVTDWAGRATGVVTLTPYDIRHRLHAAHHASAGNLEKRGIGDVRTPMVNEFRSLSSFGRLRYRFYRHPLVLFGIGPFCLFFVQNRLPVGLMPLDRLYWVSVMGTNAAIAAILGAIAYFGGPDVLLLVFLPTTLIAATVGGRLFFVQHQFEETHWDHDADWQLHEAALHGSFYYVLPDVLRWFTANIGVHHVHHLESHVPFHRLPENLLDHPQLAETQRLTLWDSLSCIGKGLWDTRRRRLVSFIDARTT